MKSLESSGVHCWWQQCSAKRRCLCPGEKDPCSKGRVGAEGSCVTPTGSSSWAQPPWRAGHGCRALLENPHCSCSVLGQATSTECFLPLLCVLNPLAVREEPLWGFRGCHCSPVSGGRRSRGCFLYRELLWGSLNLLSLLPCGPSPPALLSCPAHLCPCLSWLLSQRGECRCTEVVQEPVHVLSALSSPPVTFACPFPPSGIEMECS